MHMIFAHNPFQYLYFKRLTGLANQLSNLPSNITPKNLITILRHKYKVILDLVYRVAPITIIHTLIPQEQTEESIADKSNRLKTVVSTLKQD